MQSVARVASFWLIANLCPAIAAGQIAVAWNDFANGVGLVRVMRALPPWELRSPAIETGRDATLHYRYGRLYAVSRTDGTITVITRRGGRVRRVIDLGDRSEPEDIAVVTRRTAFVSRRSATHLLRLDPETGATADVVDLGVFAVVDIGARQEVFRHIRHFTDAGGAALIASSEYEDLAHLCDRVIVFRDGQSVAELHGDALTAETIAQQAFVSARSRENQRSRTGGEP